MKQTDLVDAFLAGATQGEAKSLHIEGDQLIHYNTPIAERRRDSKVILNYTRYSLATGKVQKMLTDRVASGGLVVVTGVPADAKGSLERYCEHDGVPESFIAKAHHKSLGGGLRALHRGRQARCRLQGEEAGVPVSRGRG